MHVPTADIYVANNNNNNPFISTVKVGILFKKELNERR